MPATEGAETAFTAPEITLEDYLRLTAARSGKPLLVNFWATWCAPCVEEMPHLVELSEEYRDRLDFLAVSADSLTLTADQVPEMMRKLKMTLPTRVLVTDDQDAAITAIHAEWQGDLPATFFYNAQGELVNRLQGGQSREELQAAIQAVLSATP
jgi:thiol-disulfide isomerase/thioredoxin